MRFLYVLSKSLDSISIGLELSEASDKMARTSFSLFALPVTKAATVSRKVLAKHIEHTQYVI